MKSNIKRGVESSSKAIELLNPEDIVELNIGVEQYSMYLPQKDADYIQEKIYKNNTPYEVGLLQDIVERLNENELFIDVGANIGNHTIFVAKIGACRVMAFEPNQDLARILEVSVALNNLEDQISIHDKALGKSKSKATFKEHIPENLGSQSLSFSNTKDEVSIDVVPLDSYDDLPPVRAMKVDVEGMELDVLIGASELIARDRPLIYAEALDEQSFSQITNFLDGFGYQIVDCFNQDPTLLFVHESEFSTASSQQEKNTLKLIARAQYLHIYNERKLHRNAHDLVNKLQYAWSKYHEIEERYRESCEQVNGLESKVEELNERSVHNEELVSTLSEKSAALNNENNDYKKSLKRLNEKVSQLELNKSEDAASIAAAKNDVADLQRQVTTYRRSLGFQLLQHLRRATTSFSALIKLPVSIWRLYKRKKIRDKKARPAESVAPLSSTNVVPVTIDDKVLNVTEKKGASKKVKNIRDVKVACVFDEFTSKCYEHECDVIKLSINDWQSQLERDKPDLLFVESAWRGNDGQWEYQVGQYQGALDELDRLVRWCNVNNVPTVFWNKEDPVNFEKFIVAAKKFDYIFTTDIEMVEKYKEHVSHSNVFPLMFSAQPQLHNPIEKYDRDDKVCFAGSYYKNVYKERQRDMTNIFDVAMGYGLVIYDRNYKQNQSKPGDLAFPEKYQECIIGALKYDEMDRAYKGYKYTLNVNSIKNSPTMFSRRVFESLASGTPVFSTPAKGLSEVFGDIVLTVNDKDDDKTVSDLFGENDLAYAKRACVGIREVYDKHLYKHRFRDIVRVTGITVDLDIEPTVCVLAFVNSETELQRVIEQHGLQTYAKTELVVVMDTKRFGESLSSVHSKIEGGIRVFDKYSMSVLEFTVSDLGSADYISVFSSDSYYAPEYLKDLVHGAEYSGAKVVGKASFYSVDAVGEIALPDKQEYQYVDDLPLAASLISVSLLDDLDPLVILQACQAKKMCTAVVGQSECQMFSIHKFDYLGLHGANQIVSEDNIALIISSENVVHCEKKRLAYGE